MKHIVQVSAFYPPHLGGQENAVHDLAHQLAAVGHNVHVLTSSQGSKPGFAKEGRVSVRRMSGIVVGHAPIMLRFPFELFHIARSDTVVHLHIGQAFTPEMVWLVSKLRKFPYIAHLHIDFKPSGPAGILLPMYKRFVLRTVLRAASHVVSLNEETYQTVRRTYGYNGDARVMNNGISEVFFAQERKPFLPIPPKTLHLLFVGRLSKQKNIPALLEALKDTRRQVHVDIVGEGDQEESIRNLIATYGLRNVSLRGRLSRGEIMKLYASSDALIMPSLYEAQPLVLLEAMAARIPIIGTDVIGVAEHIKDGGIIVEPTAAGIGLGIDRFYENYSLLPQMVKRSHERASKLRWSQTLKKYEKLYEAASAD